MLFIYFKYEIEKYNFDIFFLNGIRILFFLLWNIVLDEYDELEVEFVWVIVFN